MALPNLPIEGQDPWYDDRTAWDLAVEADLEGRLSESNLSKTFLRGVSVAAYGAVGDGIADDTQSFRDALASSPHVYVPSGTYLVTSSITTPSGMNLIGAGKAATTIQQKFDGVLFPNLASYSSIGDMTFRGYGATFASSQFATITGLANQHSLFRLRCIEYGGPVLSFDADSGSGFTAIDCNMYRINALTGTGRYAIIIEDILWNTAVPRKFIALETAGQCSISLGGSNNTEIISSILGDIEFSDESRGVNINSTRWLNQASASIKGHGNSIIGCDILPQLTITAGSDSMAIGPNAYNNPPVIDNSGNSRNQITHSVVSYTPVLTSSGTAPSLGNGTVSGRWSRAGAIVTCSVNIAMGSTTNLGTGELRISLPTPHTGLTIDYVGIGVADISGTTYMFHANIPGSVGYVRMFRDGVGSVTSTSPATFVAGSTLRLQFSYNI